MVNVGLENKQLSGRLAAQTSGRLQVVGRFGKNDHICTRKENAAGPDARCLESQDSAYWAILEIQNLFSQLWPFSMCPKKSLDYLDGQNISGTF